MSGVQHRCRVRPLPRVQAVLPPRGKVRTKMSPRRRVTAVALAVAAMLAVFVALAGQGGPVASAALAAAKSDVAKKPPHPKPHGPKATFPLDQFGPNDNDNAALQ